MDHISNINLSTRRKVQSIHKVSTEMAVLLSLLLLGLKDSTMFQRIYLMKHDELIYEFRVSKQECSNVKPIGLYIDDFYTVLFSLSSLYKLAILNLDVTHSNASYILTSQMCGRWALDNKVIVVWHIGRRSLLTIYLSTS